MRPLGAYYVMQEVHRWLHNTFKFKSVDHLSSMHTC